MPLSRTWNGKVVSCNSIKHHSPLHKSSISTSFEWLPADLLSADSAYLKSPPAGYFYPPHDIFAYLAIIKFNLYINAYANEYEFQKDLYQLFARCHDGHFHFDPDLLTKAFQWARQRSLVSISEDGTSLPVIKLYGSSLLPAFSPSVKPSKIALKGCTHSRQNC